MEAVSLIRKRDRRLRVNRRHGPFNHRPTTLSRQQQQEIFFREKEIRRSAIRKSHQVERNDELTMLPIRLIATGLSAKLFKRNYINTRKPRLFTVQTKSRLPAKLARRRKIGLRALSRLVSAKIDECTALMDLQLKGQHDYLSVRNRFTLAADKTVSQ